MQSDKRKAPRKPLRYSAWISVEGQEKRGCILSDISDTGARLDVEDAETLPDHFILLLAAHNAPRRICKVVWREKDHVGVHFEKRHSDAERSPRAKHQEETAPTLAPEAAAAEAAPASETN